MRNVRDFDKSAFEDEDIMHCFDIKGQVKGSKVCENPRELLTLNPKHKEKYQQTMLD
jgi:hypothetical protein